MKPTDSDRELVRTLLAQQAPGDTHERARAWFHYSRSLRALGRFDDANAALAEAVGIGPDVPSIAWSIGLERCRDGDWLGGLAAFDEERINDHSLWQTNVIRPFPFAHWRGGDIKDCHVLAWAEQGVGDQIMQARIIPEIAACADALTVECNRRLIPLFERRFPAVEFCPQTESSGETLSARAFDVQTSLLTSWRFAAKPPWQPANAYLVPDPQLKKQFSKTWRELGFERNIGLSWRSHAPSSGALRSIGLDLTRAWRSVPNTTFHSLQYGATQAELEHETKASGLPIYHDAGTDAGRELDRLAARIAALDLVITIDNTTAHLAGAIGTPCWLLLPLQRDWRWGRPGATQRLYESIRTFENTDASKWGGVIIDVNEALRAGDV